MKVQDQRKAVLLKAYNIFRIAVFICAFLWLLSWLYGLRLYIVTGSSLSSDIPAESVCIYNKHAWFSRVRVGDMILYEHDGMTVAHRVVARSDKALITKADSAAHNDPYVITKKEFIGKIKTHFTAGYGFFSWLKTAKGIVITGFAFAIFILLDGVFGPPLPELPDRVKKIFKKG